MEKLKVLKLRPLAEAAGVNYGKLNEAVKFESMEKSGFSKTEKKKMIAAINEDLETFTKITEV